MNAMCSLFFSLSFPGELVDDARAKAVYDVDAGKYSMNKTDTSYVVI